MTSNFNFLQPHYPALFAHVAKAEQYIYSDPTACVVRLRCFAEAFIFEISERFGIETSQNETFFDRLQNSDIKEVIDRDILSKLHSIRVGGNKAAHGSELSEHDSTWLIKEAYFISKWYYITTKCGAMTDIAEYVEPSKKSQNGHEIARDDKQLIQAQQELADLRHAHKIALKELADLNSNVEELKALRRQFAESGGVTAQSIELEVEITQANLRLTEFFNEYQLTDDQSSLVQRLEIFLTSRNHTVFLLQGYAGTGKTFITKGLTEYLRIIGRLFLVAAPTGKAAKVIRNKANVDAYTLHKTIYALNDIKQYKEQDLDGSETYRYYAELKANDLPSNTVYIVDESSMIADVSQEAEFFRFGSGFLLSDFMKFVNLDHNDHHKKIIFIGDNAQLPPVGMNFSPALNQIYLQNKFKARVDSYQLTRVVRQNQESGIVTNAQMLRNQLADKRFNKLDFDMSQSDVEHIEYEDFIDRYFQVAGTKIQDDTMIICAANRDVAEFNEQIRKILFPNQGSIQPNDKLLVVNNTELEGYFISNGEFIYVTGVNNESEQRTIELKTKQVNGEVVVTKVTLAFRSINFAIRNEFGDVLRFTSLILESFLNSKQGQLDSDHSKALYLDFRNRHRDLKPSDLEFKQKLQSDEYFNALRVKYGYAITAHKAQGSEWQNVFVKCSAPQFSSLSENYFRWLYTAITRASSKIYLLDEPHFTIGKGLKPTGDIATNNDIRQIIEESIKNLIENTEIQINNIQHFQYLERFDFSHSSEQSTTIDIHYNGKNQVTRIASKSTDEFTNYTLELLQGLPYQVNQKTTIDSSDNPTSFGQSFLDEFHQALIELISNTNIKIVTVVSYPYHQRYVFGDDNHQTVRFNIYYDGKNRFTRFQALDNKPQHTSLNRYVADLIERGFNGD